MFTFLGLFLLIAAIAMIVFKLFAVTEDKVSPNGRMIAQKSPNFILKWKYYFSGIIAAFGIFAFLVPYLWFFADRGYNYLLVHPGGTISSVVAEQGIKWRGFSKIDEWQMYIDVKVVGDNIEADIKELEGVMIPVPLRFIDQVTGEGYVSCRFKLPQDNKSFEDLAIKFRTMSNLVNNTIIPTIREQLTNTAYMFAAQDYISGDAQNFRQTFEEQLKSGTYAVEKYEYKDTIFNPISVPNQQRSIKEIQTTYEVKKILVNGVPKRIPTEITENNIIVSQVIVDEIGLDPEFKKRLELQRDESAKRQIEQQKIETAKAAQQRIIAEGERDKAQERVQQEKEQVKKLIEIETRLKQEKTNKELAQIKLETQEIEAKTIKVKADADAYEIKKKVVAGITPQTELQMRLDAGVKMVAELSKTDWPQYMINVDGNGSSKGGGTSAIEALVLPLLTQQLNMTTGKATK